MTENTPSNTSNAAKNPPPFSSRQSYDSWRKQVTAWTNITSVSKAQYAMTIALSLPADDPTHIKQRVFDTCDLNGEAGFNNLMNTLDAEFKKDETLDLCEHIDQVAHCVRKSGDTMVHFLTDFDTKLAKAKAKGLGDLPDVYLMYLVLKGANIDDIQQKLVLSEVDISKPKCYEQIRKALKKLFGGLTSQDKSNDNSTLSTCHDTHYAPRPFRPPFRPQHQPEPWRNPNTRQGQQQQRFQHSSFPSKPINPKDRDGKIQLCKSCGSYRHFVANCPYNVPLPNRQFNSHFTDTSAPDFSFP